MRSNNREHVLRVTISDCEVQTFRAGGKGGQNQNKRDSGVRVIHHPSGARGESREGRGQLENKKIAFGRMARSYDFNQWVEEMHLKKDRLLSVTQMVDNMLRPENLEIEYYDPSI